MVSDGETELEPREQHLCFLDAHDVSRYQSEYGCECEDTSKSQELSLGLSI
jgi:hypothetical protein